MAYQVRLEHFEGAAGPPAVPDQGTRGGYLRPSPISLVTQQYLQYLELLKLLDLEVGQRVPAHGGDAVAHQVEDAPCPRRPEEEEDEARRPAGGNSCSACWNTGGFKEAAGGAETSTRDRNADVFYHPATEENWDEDLNGVGDPSIPGWPANLNLWDLLQAFKFTLDRAKDDFDRTVERETISIEDRMGRYPGKT